MSARLTVFFYIILCLQVGAILAFLPWMRPLEVIGDWGENFFLVYAAQKAGMPALQKVFASGWVRGAVSGLGVLNLVMAFWEIAHFQQSVRALEQVQSSVATPRQAAQPEPPARDETDAPRPSETPDLSHHERRDDRGDQSFEH